MITIPHLEKLADPAQTAEDYSLINSKFTHGFTYITKNELNLGEVANAFYHNNLEIVEAWTEADEIRFYKQLDEVPGDNWMIVLIQPFYIMKQLRLVKG